MGDGAAHAALADLLTAWTKRLGIPRLDMFGLVGDRVDQVLAGISASSMATNPVDLDADDLRAILRG
jgi:alcohol dehydrogenase class IV